MHVGVWCLGEFGDHLVSGRASAIPILRRRIWRGPPARCPFSPLFCFGEGSPWTTEKEGTLILTSLLGGLVGFWHASQFELHGI